MTPEEKAKELYSKFFRLTPQPYTVSEVEAEPFKGLQFSEWDKDWTERMAKQCALIAVDEIIIALKFANDSKYYVGQHTYWQQVKEEILKL